MNLYEIIESATQADVWVCGDVKQASAKFENRTALVTIGKTKQTVVQITDTNHTYIDADAEHVFKLIVKKQMELLK